MPKSKTTSNDKSTAEKKVSASAPPKQKAELKKAKLTLAQLKRMPKKDYMNPEQLEFFRDLLLQLREEAEAHIAQVKMELASEMRTSDENDIASLEEERMIKLRIIDRESKLIPKILNSLRQIEDGSYGYCEETGEPIGVERLLLRPTATLSIAAKAFHEQKEKEYFD